MEKELKEFYRKATLRELKAVAIRLINNSNSKKKLGWMLRDFGESICRRLKSK